MRESAPNIPYIHVRGISGTKTRLDTAAAAAMLADFNAVTRIPVSLHTFIEGAVEMQAVGIGTNDDTSICALCREKRYPLFRRRCFDANREHLVACRESGEPEIYVCHMGFREAIIPVLTVGNERTVIYLGRVDSNEAGDSFFESILSKINEIQPEILAQNSGMELRRRYDRMARMSMETFVSCVHIAQAIAALLAGRKIVSGRNVSYREAFEKYVSENIRRRIMRGNAAAYLGIAPEYLSRIIRKEFGCSFSQYVLRKKTEEICAELLASDAPVCSVAAGFGFDNIKYFYQLFARQTGYTPGEYRRAHMAE